MATTFVQQGVGKHKGYEYGRSGNPTRSALEECLAALEDARHCLAFASGLGAEATLMLLLSPGDHVVYMEDVYGGTFRLFDKVLKRYGLSFTAVDASDVDRVESAMTDKTRMVWLESPTNPLLRIVDIDAVSEIAHSHNAMVCVDNTFATPYLQQPLHLGADVVVHSTTKYLGGHSDVVGGALVVADPGFGEELAYHQNAMGGVPGAFDAWLVLRGAKTLGVRMDRHCANAQRVVELLQGSDKVASVLYPGLPGHPGHEIAAKQMRDFGGMVSFRLVGGEQAALEVCRRTKVFTLGESLGGVESLIEHPGRMTHASVAGSQLEVPADLVRLSVEIGRASCRERV